jgi:hypothetical protein
MPDDDNRGTFCVSCNHEMMTVPGPDTNNSLCCMDRAALTALHSCIALSCGWRRVIVRSCKCLHEQACRYWCAWHAELQRTLPPKTAFCTAYVQNQAESLGDSMPCHTQALMSSSQGWLVARESGFVHVAHLCQCSASIRSRTCRLLDVSESCNPCNIAVDQQGKH